MRLVNDSDLYYKAIYDENEKVVATNVSIHNYRAVFKLSKSISNKVIEFAWAKGRSYSWLCKEHPEKLL